MRDHELEMIAALVEGRLEDESEARALIASSPELSEEYEAQRLAHRVLQEIGTASLTEVERARLHRDLWSSLRSTTTPTARTPWYYRWVPATAALFVVVGLVAVIYESGGQDSGATQATAESAEDRTVTTMAGAAASEGDDTPTDGAGAETLTTQASIDEPAVPPSDDEATYYSLEASKLREGDFSGELEPVDNPENLEESGIDSCVTTAGLADFRVVATLDGAPTGDVASTTTTENMSTTTAATQVDPPEIAVAVPEDAALATAPMAFVDLTSCEIVYTDE